MECCWIIQVLVSSSKANVNFLNSDVLLDREIQKAWNQDFELEKEDFEFPTSVEDRIAYSMLSESVIHTNGKYQAPLLWKRDVKLPAGSKVLAQKRLGYLKKRLLRDVELKEKYIQRMEEYIAEGYAQLVPESELSESDWYLCHHPVSTPTKPKVRIVFDCAAVYRGMSLNDALMSGPDLVTPLVSVLTNFRKEVIPLVADVKAMYHQVKVSDQDSHYQRFLWWSQGDFSTNPRTYQMSVHVFGNTGSPCVATFCLRKTAEEFGEDFNQEVVKEIKKGMYVDDLLTSVSTESKAIEWRRQLSELLEKGGFHLTKWNSNNLAVMADVPESDRAKSIEEMKFTEPQKERVLGCYWNVKTDEFMFRTSHIQPKVFTRRGTLSAVNSLFDPMGMLSPATLVAKLLIQKNILEGYGWDEDLSHDDTESWKKWFDDISLLNQLAIRRCFKPIDFGEVKTFQIHHFCDASLQGYGTVSYLRMCDFSGKVHCAFLCGKARVTPPRTESIPRLELVSAVLAVKADRWLKKVLDFVNCESVFWTDSSAVR